METLRLRVASLEDAKRLYDWSRSVSPGDPTPWGLPVWEDHLLWLALVLGPTDQLILIGEAVRTDEAIGAVRLDDRGEGRWEVAILIAPAFRGRGWSRKLLAGGLVHLDAEEFHARVSAVDEAAGALFRGHGFDLVSSAAGVDLYRFRPEARP